MAENEAFEAHSGNGEVSASSRNKNGGGRDVCTPSKAWHVNREKMYSLLVINANNEKPGESTTRRIIICLVEKWKL